MEHLCRLEMSHRCCQRSGKRTLGGQENREAGPLGLPWSLPTGGLSHRFWAHPAFACVPPIPRLKLRPWEEGVSWVSLSINRTITLAWIFHQKLQQTYCKEPDGKNFRLLWTRLSLSQLLKSAFVSAWATVHGIQMWAGLCSDKKFYRIWLPSADPRSVRLVRSLWP